MASDVRSTWWIADGIDGKFEREGAQSLLNLVVWGEVDRTTLRHILTSPFLESFEPPDSWALRELAYFASNEDHYFEGLIEHPVIREGITDSTAKLIGALYPLDYNRDLRPLAGQTFMAEHIIDLPVSGETFLTVIRIGQPPADATMNRLEEVVRGLDSLLQLPLPTNNILLLVSDNAYNAWGDPQDSEHYGGLNYGGQMVILEVLDTEATGIWGSSGYIAHETAHYFFYNGPPWIVEGFAEGAQEILKSILTNKPLDLSDPELAACPGIATYAQLQAALDDFGSDQDYTLEHCRSQFGVHVLVRLYLELDPDTFHDGLKTLYSKTGAFSNEGTPTVTDVIEAFGPKAAAILEGNTPTEKSDT